MAVNLIGEDIKISLVDANSVKFSKELIIIPAYVAKGLEFDNVIIFDAIEGRYPNYYHQNNANMVAEDARKFYVAMTRAKKRLYVSICQTRMDYKNQPQMRKITRLSGFLDPDRGVRFIFYMER